ncbi:hypothetical protein RF11_04460 [Thelohanellus kitauei]|uniref:ISXO2-like transposase domain-containing protein n=1 Tax=Thelohanellus kitauei TaxID=669202 RepID=A0A0C2MYQ3_THEKT|nr:hypothetical protein RF11_04460 [Thelohanellus kitauei]
MALKRSMFQGTEVAYVVLRNICQFCDDSIGSWQALEISNWTQLWVQAQNINTINEVFAKDDGCNHRSCWMPNRRKKQWENKYPRGHPAMSALVLGGIERTSERKAFLVEVSDRTEETLVRIISNYVLPGSTIIKKLLYIRAPDSLSLVNFTGPSGRAHINTIEGFVECV